MKNKDFNTALELTNAFPDEDICIKHLENLRWENGAVISPFDAKSKVYACKGNRYRCKNTSKYFNVKTGTLFDNSKVKLKKWFLAIWLFTSHNKDISSVQLSKEIGVTQKTAWFMLLRIRKCFGYDNDNNLTDYGKTKHPQKSKKIKTYQESCAIDQALRFYSINLEYKLNYKHIHSILSRFQLQCSTLTHVPL